MNLREFVSQTLLEIVQGVEDAQTGLGDKGKGICPPIFTAGSMPELMKKHLFTTGNKLVQLVEFDVAVTVEKGTDTKGGIGVFIGAVGLGTQGASSDSNSSASHIKFTVPISLPTKN